MRIRDRRNAETHQAGYTSKSDRIHELCKQGSVRRSTPRRILEPDKPDVYKKREITDQFHKAI